MQVFDGKAHSGPNLFGEIEPDSTDFSKKSEEGRLSPVFLNEGTDWGLQTTQNQNKRGELSHVHEQ
jgi:hypothetical protein